jgi:hypothetical protein
VDELLIGFLLEALDSEQQQAVAARLDADPALRARLEVLRNMLAPLALDDESPEPPRGLAASTLSRIAEYRSRSLPQAPVVTPYQRDTRNRRSFRRADAVVAALLLILIVPLVITGVARGWRDHAQRAACANNLRELGGALQRYADHHDGRFPQLHPAGPQSFAGSFIPVLHESGALTPDAPVVCPGDGTPPRTLPSLAALEDLYWHQPEAFAAAIRDLGGSYAYAMGYQENGQLHGPNRGDDEHTPILADRLPPAAVGNSPNHGGAGQNVLYIGGNVAWCTLRTVGVNADDIYLNRRAEVRAGVCREDAVLGCSDATPLPAGP